MSAARGEQTPPGYAPVLEGLLATYARVETLSAEVRKTRSGDGQYQRLLSRVHYARPDRIHVENVSPYKRRIVCDGTRLFYHRDGDARGYAQHVDALPEGWMLRLRTVPATPMDHLLRLRGLPEETLDPTPEHPIRRGYQSDKKYVVLALDAEGRPVEIRFVPERAATEASAVVRYQAFEEPEPGLWIPTVHRALVVYGGEEITDVTRFTNLAVNQPVPEALFVAAPFFPKVDWRDRFEETASTPYD